MNTLTQLKGDPLDPDSLLEPVHCHDIVVVQLSGTIVGFNTEVRKKDSERDGVKGSGALRKSKLSSRRANSSAAAMVACSSGRSSWRNLCLLGMDVPVAPTLSPIFNIAACARA